MINGQSKIKLSNLSYLKCHYGDMSDEKRSQDLSNFMLSENDIQPKINQQIQSAREQSIIVQIDQQQDIINTQNDETKNDKQIMETPLPQIKFSQQKSQTEVIQSQSINNSSIMNLEIQSNKNILKKIFKNIVIIMIVCLIGPLVSTYLLWKYQILKNKTIYVKISILFHVTARTIMLSLFFWVMVITLFMGVTQFKQADFNYYKIEFMINTMILVIFALGYSIIGNIAFFNNNFFSELYYLSEQQQNVFKELNKSKSSTQISKMNLLSKLFCNPTADIQHPLNSQYNNYPIFEKQQREKIMEEVLVKVMKEHFIDSLSFKFLLLPFNIKGSFKRKINISIHEERKEIENKEAEKEQIDQPQIVNRSKEFISRLETIKFKQSDHIYDATQLQILKEQESDEYKINGRKLCYELLIYSEKQSSLQPKRMKKFLFFLFILFKGFIPSLFRIHDNLQFYGDNIFIGVVCQLSRQFSYGILIGFLIFSIDLDVLNRFTQMTNKLIDYTIYLQKETSRQNESSPKKRTRNIKFQSPISLKHKNKVIKIDNETNFMNFKEKIEQISFQKNDKNESFKNNKEKQQKKQENTIIKEQHERIIQIENGNNQKDNFDVDDEDIFDNSQNTPSIDFTDINSLISWNNIRKLGFHCKQKDIVQIDRIGLIFSLELIVIILFFVVNYFSLFEIGKEYKEPWVQVMLFLDIIVVIYTQLNRVHVQTQINKSFLQSTKAVIRVQSFLQQSYLTNIQQHIIINKHKKKDKINDDQVLQFFLKIKKKLIIREKDDPNYYLKIIRVVQFIQDDIKYDMNNDQLFFLGLIKATPAFEATLFSCVAGCVYWLFRYYMKYLEVDIGLLGF